MDLQILSFINHFWQGTRIDTLSQIVSRRWGMLVIWTLIIAIVVFLKKKHRRFVVLSFLLAWALSYGLFEIGFKTLLIQETGIRTRPYIAHAQTIKPLGKLYTDSSFPSGHTAVTVALLTVLIMIFPTLWPYAVLYALLMGWSRMHNGMHYPSDVLAGAVMGLGCGRIALVLSRKVFKPEWYSR